jgi:hypothetical protein
MKKFKRREAPHMVVWYLFGGAGLLGGCHTPSGYKPALPESCTWLKFPYTWVCVDPEEGRRVPEKEASMRGSYSLETLDFIWESPLSWEELAGRTGKAPLCLKDACPEISPAQILWDGLQISEESTK